MGSCSLSPRLPSARTGVELAHGSRPRRSALQVPVLRYSSLGSAHHASCVAQQVKLRSDSNEILCLPRKGKGRLLTAALRVISPALCEPFCDCACAPALLSHASSR